MKFQKVELPKRIRCVQDLIGEISSLRGSRSKQHGDSPIWFRGQGNAKDHELKPAIGRKFEYNGQVLNGFSEQSEKKLLSRFIRHAYPHVDRLMGKWEALIIGRHHGLPTRLLDWTYSPLATLYFACSCHAEDDGDIWAITKPEGDQYYIDVSDSIRSESANNDPFAYGGNSSARRGRQNRDAVKIVLGIDVTARIQTQRGIFTLHSNPYRPLDSYAEIEFKKGLLDISRLYHWIIEARNKTTIVKELEVLGLNSRVIFPDLDGLAKELWQTEVLWHGRKKGPLSSKRALK